MCGKYSSMDYQTFRPRTKNVVLTEITNNEIFSQTIAMTRK